MLAVPDREKAFTPGITLLARVVNDHVLTDIDPFDRPLWRELVRAGIPREQIVLLYAGELPPDTENNHRPITLPH